MTEKNNLFEKNPKILLKEFQVIKSLKIWWSMAEIVCNASPNVQ